MVCWKRDLLFLKVDASHTSQICPEGGTHTGNKELSQRVHYCPDCHHQGDRDVAAAQVLAQSGLTAVGHTVKMLDQGVKGSLPRNLRIPTPLGWGVSKQQIWVALVEAKSKRFSVDEALPQILFYMMGNPTLEKPAFGFARNGSHFIFLKLTQQDTPQYAIPDEFTLKRRGNELYGVLGILRQLGTLVAR